MRIKENSGRSIQDIASVIFVMGVILAILEGFSIGGLIFKISQGIGIFIALVIIIIIIVGSVLSWVLTRILYGFGEIVEFTAESASYLEYLSTNKATPETKRTTEVLTNIPPEEAIYCPNCGIKHSKESLNCRACERELPKNPQAEISNAPKRNYSELVYCPHCASANSSVNTKCFSCGKEL